MSHSKHKDDQTWWLVSISVMFFIPWMNFNTSQSVPCGALLVFCCYSCCLGGHEGHRDPGGKGTGHRLLKSLKSISWQLAAGKLAISNHQVPDHFAHIFRKLFFLICSLPLLQGLTRLSSPAGLMHGAAALERVEKPNLTWVTFALSWKPPGSPSNLWVTVNIVNQATFTSYAFFIFIVLSVHIMHT